MRLLVLDGNSIANRAFYGIKLLTTRDGRFTNAVFGFMNILQSLLQKTQPEAVAVAFDLKAPTFRHKMYDGYKATRHGMPEELAQQMPVIKELLTALGYTLVTAEGWEADDILGTLAAACEKRGDECFIATGDRDSLQLVSGSTTVLLASMVMGKSTTLVMDEAAVREKYGLVPKQLIDLKSLMGDTSDNIPGVKGIGEKTALGLVQAFGSLSGVYEHLDDPMIKPKQRENLQTYKENADLSYVLGTIRKDAPVDTDPAAYTVGKGDEAAAVRLLKSLEMFSFIGRLGLDPGADSRQTAENLPAETESGAERPAKPLPEVTPQPLPEELKGTWLIAERPEEVEKQGAKNVVTRPAAWYGVQGETVCLLNDGDLFRLLDSRTVRLEVFDSAPLYAFGMAKGSSCDAIAWDGKLAAYLLDASGSKYTVELLTASYDAAPAFLCRECPEAGRLADLFAKLKAALTAAEQDELYETIEFPLARVLADMTLNGILVDAEGIRSFGDEIVAELKKAEQQVYEKVGYAFNINSPKQLGEALFEKMGLPHGKKTKTGWATDAATLEELKSESPVIGDILRYRTYQKLNSTYVEGLLAAIGSDGRIHGRFKQTEARTGRLSSDEPNLQNIPIRTELGSRLRAYFIAKPGCVLLDADYSQIELRILAHISGDKNMQKAFLDGEDIHRATAAKIYGISPIEVTPQLRSRAKAINFGIMYGKGAFSLSSDIGVSIPEAEAFLHNYLAAFPTVDGFMKKTIAEARDRGYTTTLFGRRRALPELRSSNYQLRMSGERMARNTPIQGTAADIIKLAMVRVWNRLKAEGLESRLILTVHDELIVEAPKAEADAAGRILQEEMEHCANYAVPLSTELGRGKNWLEAH